MTIIIVIGNYHKLLSFVTTLPQSHSRARPLCIRSIVSPCYSRKGFPVKVNTRNLSSQFKLAKSFRGGGMHNFVQAKQEINAIFGHLTEYLEACDEFLANYKIAFEDERGIDIFSSEVRLSIIAFKRHDNDENW